MSAQLFSPIADLDNVDNASWKEVSSSSSATIDHGAKFSPQQLKNPKLVDDITDKNSSTGIVPKDIHLLMTSERYVGSICS